MTCIHSLFSRQVVSDSFATTWTVAHQAPLSMGFCRQEYWSGLPFPSPGDLPDPGIEPSSPALAGRFFTSGPPGKPMGKIASWWEVAVSTGGSAWCSVMT